jgi:hypothetical protein
MPVIEGLDDLGKGLLFFLGVGVCTELRDGRKCCCVARFKGCAALFFLVEMASGL